MTTTTKMHPLRILHLVLYSEDKIAYKKMFHATRRWYETFESKGITTLYYLRDSKVTEPTRDVRFPMLLRLPGNEGYTPGILEKTLQVLRHFFPEEKDSKTVIPPFDCVLRSNISTVVNLAHILRLLETGTNIPFYGGTHIMTVQSISSTKESEKKLAPLTFAHGTCIVLRHDAVRFLLDNVTQLSREIEDDASIGLFFKQVRAVTAQARYDPRAIGSQFAFFESSFPLDHASAFRCHRFHSDREEDTENVQRAVRTLFQFYVFLLTPRVVKRVEYYNVDVTAKIRELCTDGKKWETNQNNSTLDNLFGDPCPEQVKTLLVFFDEKEGDIAPYAQRSTLLFSHDGTMLYVQGVV